MEVCVETESKFSVFLDMPLLKMILSLSRYQWTILKFAAVLIFGVNIYLLLRIMSDEKIIQIRASVSNGQDIQQYLQRKGLAEASKQVHPIGHLLPASNSSADSKKCNLPKLSLQNDPLSFAFHSMEPLNCTGMNLFYLQENFLILNKTALDDRKLEKCKVSFIKREGDLSYSTINLMDISGKEIPFISQDFLYIKCNFDPKNETEINGGDKESRSVNVVKESNSSVELHNSEAQMTLGKGSHVAQPSEMIQSIGTTLKKRAVNPLPEAQMSPDKRNGVLQPSKVNKTIVAALKKGAVNSLPSNKILNANSMRKSKNSSVSKNSSPISNSSSVRKSQPSENTRDASFYNKHKPKKKETSRANSENVSSHILKYRNKLPEINARPNSRRLLQDPWVAKNEISGLDQEENNEDSDFYKAHLAALGEIEYNENGDEVTDEDFENMYPDGDPWSSYETDWIEQEEEPCDREQFLVQISPHQDVFDRARKAVGSKKGRDLNILMFGIDSMSRMTFERKLPQTLDFLKNRLGATIFEGYNIVGDGTTQALLPIFTGKLQQEIPDILEMYLDDLDFVWKRYQEQGYATVFAEDEPNLGVFNLRLRGFDMQPTDHYMRYFWQARADSHLKEACQQDFCTGATPNHKFLLQYVEDFFHKYRNISRFAVGFSGELSHDENNPSQYLDKDLKNFLHDLQKKGHLKNTVLFVFADHGCRKGSFRRTLQGKLEERLPFFSMTLPTWFKKKHKNLFKNVVRNSDRLTSPFDVHETLKDLLDLSKIDAKPVQPGRRGISLLQPIPADRTCFQAGIDTHWCTCVQQHPVPATDPVVKGAVNAVISAINNLTKADRHLCAPLTLNSTHSASLVVPNEQLLKFHRTEETGNFAVTYGNHTLDMAEFQVTVETDKCQGIFEATVQARFGRREEEDEEEEEGGGDSNKFEISYNVLEHAISRIDTYGSQSACICHSRPQIMKFCCCNDFLEGKKVKGC